MRTLKDGVVVHADKMKEGLAVAMLTDPEPIMPRCPRCGNKFVAAEYHNAICFKCDSELRKECRL